MRSALLIVVLLFTLALPAHAATGYPQEKIQLFTNGSRFVTGDTVRFRAFVQDAASGSETKKLSQFIYVELIDPFGTVHSRIKVRNLDGVFAGVMPLDRELPESRYTLAAYTTYMLNRARNTFRAPRSRSAAYMPTNTESHPKSADANSRSGSPNVQPENRSEARASCSTAPTES